MTARLSDLDHALLGLLARRPATGYELRLIFQTTPLGSYSDSPGSIYPALARLERGGYLRAHHEVSGRRRRTLRLTPKGTSALGRWLAVPVRAEELIRDRGSAPLRLAFISEVAPGRLRPFLREYAQAIAKRLEALLETEEKVMRGLPPSARLAYSLGIEVYRAQAAWCRRILQQRGPK